MEQVQGCGWGCILVPLVIGVVLLCVLLPYVGVPLGLTLVIGVVIFALMRTRNPPPEDPTPS